MLSDLEAGWISESRHINHIVKVGYNLKSSRNKMNHYVYYSYEEWGRGYIGRRSCPCSPQEDLYFGSFRDKNFQPTYKEILGEFDSVEEAIEAEILLHNFFSVRENEHFANLAHQTSTGFSGGASGKRWWNNGEIQVLREECPDGFVAGRIPESEETRKKKSESHRGLTDSDATRRKKGKGRKGKRHTEEAKKKISEAKSGTKHTKETKQKMSEIHSGRAKTPEHRKRISEALRKFHST